jgi:hypothetical protein
MVPVPPQPLQINSIYTNKCDTTYLICIIQDLKFEMCNYACFFSDKSYIFAAGLKDIIPYGSKTVVDYNFKQCFQKLIQKLVYYLHINPQRTPSDMPYWSLC